MSKQNLSGRNVAALTAATSAALAGMFGGVQDANAVAVNLTAATYTQNFDHSTWAKGGGSSMGTGWALSETGTGANASYVDGAGASATADTYVYHTGNDNDLAFGTLRGATTLVSTIGANFANTLGAGNNIVAVQIAYTGEQWRRGGTGTDQLDFQISTDATSLTTGTWTDHNALDFASLQNSGGAAALDGNAAANRNTGISSTISGLNIANTSQFWIRWNDADNTVEHALGLEDFSLKVLTTGYDSQITSAGSVAFGRVMQNLTPSNNSSATLTKTGTQGTTYTAIATVGATVSAAGTFAAGNQNETLTIGLANNASGTGTTGVKAYTVTIDNQSATSGAAGQGSADANDVINVTATVLANRVVTASNVNLGRRMVNIGVSGASNLTTTLDNNNATALTVAATAGANGDGITVASGSGTAFNSGASTGTRNLGGSFSTTGNKSGSVTLNTTGEGLSGEVVNVVAVPYTATSVANRVVSASSVGLGVALVNTAMGGSSSLGTTGDNDNFTAVSVATLGGPDGNGVSVTGGSGNLFDAAADTGLRNVGATFASAGGYTGSVLLTTTGEGLAGEAPIDVLVPYTATALDHSNGSFATPTDTNTISINFGSVALNSSQSQGFNIFNLLATLGFTAALDLDAINGFGDTGIFTHNVSATQIAAGGGNGYSIFFNTNTLGPYSASYVIDVSDEDLPGAAAGDQMTINIAGQVVPEPTSLALIAGTLLAGTLRPRRRRKENVR